MISHESDVIHQLITCVRGACYPRDCQKATVDCWNVAAGDSALWDRGNGYRCRQAASAHWESE